MCALRCLRKHAGTVSRPGSAQGLRHGSSAFTLVELLVVVTIIALLIAILLPSLKKARYQGKNVVCMANLHAIGAGSSAYASESPRNTYPDGETLGFASFRVTAKKTFAFGEEETLSLPAVYDRSRIMPADSKVWICPLNMTPLTGPEKIMGDGQYKLERDYGITYRITTNNITTQNPHAYKPGGMSGTERDGPSEDSKQRRLNYWVTDNWNIRPYKSAEVNTAVLNRGDPLRSGGNNTSQFRESFYWHKGTNKRATLANEDDEGEKLGNGWGVNALMMDLSAGFQVQSNNKREPRA